MIPTGESYFKIDNLDVSPELRNYGIGGSLVTRLLEEAKQQGFNYGLVYSAAKDVKSILKFYERYNFQSRNIQMFQKL